MKPREIHIGGRAIGDGHPTYIIAELSGNHNGSLERALTQGPNRVADGVDASNGLWGRGPQVFTLCLECHNGAGTFGREGTGVIAQLANGLGLAPIELGRIDAGGRLIQARNALVLRPLIEQPRS